MNIEDIDVNAISSLLGSLSSEDIASLESAAQSIFSGGSEQDSRVKRQNESIFDGMDLETITRLASVMSVFSQQANDPRCDFLRALKPLIGKEKHQKVDQAIKMLRLFSVIPKLRNGGDL